jgi:hypothetical protein
LTHRERGETLFAVSWNWLLQDELPRDARSFLRVSPCSKQQQLTANSVVITVSSGWQIIHLTNDEARYGVVRKGEADRWEEGDWYGEEESGEEGVG